METPKKICKSFLKGECYNGYKCKKEHKLPDIQPCPKYLAGSHRYNIFCKLPHVSLRVYKSYNDMCKRYFKGVCDPNSCWNKCNGSHNETICPFFLDNKCTIPEYCINLHRYPINDKLLKILTLDRPHTFLVVNRTTNIDRVCFQQIYRSSDSINFQVESIDYSDLFREPTRDIGYCHVNSIERRYYNIINRSRILYKLNESVPVLIDLVAIIFGYIDELETKVETNV